jgi:hypothetical protein
LYLGFADSIQIRLLSFQPPQTTMHHTAAVLTAEKSMITPPPSRGMW